MLDSQDAFLRLNRQPGSVLPHLDAEGKPLVPPDFYITGYSQLTTNGVQRLPDPMDWPKPRELLHFACLPEHESQSQNSKTQKLKKRIPFLSL